LTWLGGNPVEEPYIILGQIFSCLYFIILLLLPLCFSINSIGDSYSLGKWH
jgi:hypothetical protein